jgi:hypothetical protein
MIIFKKISIKFKNNSKKILFKTINLNKIHQIIMILINYNLIKIMINISITNLNFTEIAMNFIKILMI